MYKHSLKEMIYLLLEENNAMRMKDIAEHLHMSEKTVWNKLHSDELEEVLGCEVTLEKKPNNGIALVGNKRALDALREKLEGFIDQERDKDDYIANQILLTMLLSEQVLTMQVLMDQFLITKKTLSMYLDEITKRLQKFQLRIEKKQNAGIRIVGDEINIRQFLEHTILLQCGYEKQAHHQNTVFDETITSILQSHDLDGFLDNALNCVKAIQHELLGVFTDEGKKEIVLQILITNRRCKQEHQIHVIDQETFTSNMQFHQFLKIFERNRFILTENDYLYLWKRCVTNRFSVTTQKHVDDKFLALSKELLRSVLDLKDQESEEVNYLIKNLAFHIYQAVNRSALGIRVHNPVLQKVKQKYGKFYSMVLTNVSNFEKEYQISLNEDEIGFITIYICAIYEKSISSNYYKVLLVSDEGVGQTQLLSMQIVNNFPNLLIHETSSSLHLDDRVIYESDIVIATCPLMLRLEERHKYIRISNFIDQHDLRSISAHLLNMGKWMVEQHVYDDPKETIDFKYFNSNVASREEAIQLYLQMAEQFGYCDAEYIHSVMDRELRASTSIGKGIAIPHGDDKHIMKPAVFFVRNTQPISWGEDQVDIVMFLILKFTNIQANKQFFMRLYSSIEKSEIIRKIKDAKSLHVLEEYILKGGQE